MGVSGKAGRRVSKKRNKAFIGSHKTSIAVRPDARVNSLSEIFTFVVGSRDYFNKNMRHTCVLIVIDPSV